MNTGTIYIIHNKKIVIIEKTFRDHDMFFLAYHFCQIRKQGLGAFSCIYIYGRHFKITED